MNSSKRIVSVVATSIVALSLLSAGCKNDAPIEPRAERYAPRQTEVTSDELRNDTMVDQANVTYNESGLLVVTIPIRSTIDKTLYVDCLVTFFDANGQPIGGTLRLPTKTLQAHASDYVTFNATSPRAKDFHAVLKYAR